MLFLRLTVRIGAAFTGYYELDSSRIECPYEGAHAHAEELESEGLLVRRPFEGMPTCVIWIPTAAGRILGQSATD